MWRRRRPGRRRRRWQRCGSRAGVALVIIKSLRQSPLLRFQPRSIGREKSVLDAVKCDASVGFVLASVAARREWRLPRSDSDADFRRFDAGASDTADHRFHRHHIRQWRSRAQLLHMLQKLLSSSAARAPAFAASWKSSPVERARFLACSQASYCNLLNLYAISPSGPSPSTAPCGCCGFLLRHFLVPISISKQALAICVMLL
jgi:hypothetical protein